MALSATYERFPIGSGSEGSADKWHNKFRLAPVPTVSVCRPDSNAAQLEKVRTQ
jgi:hypothetical protein